jgi:ABC-type ATPase involved in cell division
MSTPPPAAAAPPLLALEKVEKRYGAFRPALVDLDLTVARGEFVVLRGAGGAGKSVLLRLLAGQESPSGGTIRIAGEDLARMRPRARAHLRRSLGIVPPGACLLERRSVVENVALAAWVAGISREEGVRRAHAALALVGIDAERYGAARCAELAGGQRQCVALARALVNRPALLLLDDLLAPLDAEAAARVVQVLDGFAAAGVTVIVAARPESRGAEAGPWPARARMLSLHDGRIAA